MNKHAESNPTRNTLHKVITMPFKNRSKTNTTKFKEIIAGYATPKVIDWVLKNKVDQGAAASFAWSAQDKQLLKKILLDPTVVPSEVPLSNLRYKKFFQSVIDNGLNADDVRLFQRHKNKLPLRALGLAYDLADFEAEDEALVSNKKIEAGFYMLEVTISPKSYSSHLPFILTEAPRKGTELTSFPLYVKAEKITKRLIKLDEDTALVIKPDPSWAQKDLKHFKLAKLTRNFFLSRLYKKLGNNFSLQAGAAVSDAQLLKAWKQYEHIFTRQLNHQRVGYHVAITTEEKKVIPSAAEQMRNLIRSLLK